MSYTKIFDPFELIFVQGERQGPSFNLQIAGFPFVGETLFSSLCLWLICQRSDGCSGFNSKEDTKFYFPGGHMNTFNKINVIPVLGIVFAFTNNLVIYILCIQVGNILSVGQNIFFLF
jgi:hypothetical protein